MLIHRRVNVAKEGQTEKLLELITGWFEQRNPWSATHIYKSHSGPKDHTGSNLNHVVIELESESLVADEEADAQWRSGVTKEDEKAWSELVETVIVEYWTVSDLYEKRE